jgi:hypothetical protein
VSYYASFQGRVYLGKRDINGLPIEVRSPGNVADLKLSLKTEVLEHYESQSGQRSLDHRMIKSKSATINLSIEEFTKENLALALYGTHVATTGGTVTDEPVGGATPVVGDRYFLAHPKVSTLVVKDSAGTPATLTLGTHYTADTDFGALQFLDTTGLTAPFKASYLRNVNVQWDRIDTHDLLTMDFHPSEQATFRVRSGDVLICEGGEIGRAAIWSGQVEECYYQKALHKLTPDKSVVRSDFVVWLLWHLAKSNALGTSGHATIAHLTGIQLKNLVVIAPPIDMQIEFEKMVERCHGIQKQQSVAAAKAQATFDVLLARAFA